MNNQFTFEKKQKSTLLGFMVLGIVCLGALFAIDHTRFWSEFLHNSVFFTGIAFISLFFIAASVTAYAGWYTVMKRIWEAYSQFLIVGLILMGIMAAANWSGVAHIYHWADPHALDLDENGNPLDPILTGKSSFLNNGWYTFGSLIILATWVFFARKLRALSLEEENTAGVADYSIHNKIRFWSAVFMPIAGFTSAAMVWQWVMSVDAHWYSTLYAWYATASWFVSAMSLTMLTIIYLKSKNYFANISPEHIHDLGKLLFAFSIFWTYLWFSQYMLIWYGNNGEETIYFRHRIDSYPVLFYGNLIINFLVPFFVLMRNDTKRKLGSVGLVAVVIFIGHWIDFFLMLKPGIRLTSLHINHIDQVLPFAAGYTLPGLLDIGVMLGFLAGFLYVVFTQLAKAPLESVNDPYYEESVHHHV